MIETIYLEKEILEHPRAQRILKKFPQAHLVLCDRFGEVFNSKAQNFRLQKLKPSLILAKKHAPRVLRVPKDHGLNKTHNFYFSHMLNCLYDCRYCFLQGMYRSAHYVVFVNFEDFQKEIEEKIKASPEGATFFSGYDGDSLAFDQITRFIDDFVPFFKNHPNHELEIRSKSQNISSLLNKTPLQNVVIAYSLNPSWVVHHIEHKTARLHQRLKALKKLQEMGWPIGLRFDPLIYHPNWQKNYEELFNQVFEILDPNKIHSVTLGPFRLPSVLYKNIQSQFPDEPLFFHEIETQQNQVTYRREIEEMMHSFCTQKLLSHLSESIFFPSPLLGAH